MHTHLKSHLTKFNFKSNHIKEGSAFWKHLKYSHYGLKEGEQFSDYFEVNIIKAHSKPMTRVIEEAELLNYKNLWHPPKIIRTTILHSGTEMAGPPRVAFPRDGET